MAPYAYICLACHHPASEHRLAAGGDLRAGPYICNDCGCETTQDAPTTGLSRREFERYQVERVREDEHHDDN